MKVKIGDICEVVSGSTPNTNIAEYWDGDIDWITPAEITDDTYVIEKSIRKISRLGVEKAGLKSFPEGTVILSSRAPIGKVAIAGKEMYCNQGFKNLICSSAVLPEYLYWFLKGNSIYLNSLGRGATFKEISKGIVEGIEVSLPSTDEQQIIIEKIKKCWNILILRKSQLEKFDELTKARFVEMFGEIETNPKGWKKEALKTHIDMLTGYPFESTGYTEEGIKICGGLIILPNGIKWDECKYWQSVKGYEQFLLKSGDIVVALDRPWIADGFKIGIISNEDLPALLIQRTARIRGLDLEQEFLLYLLKDKAFEHQCTVTGSLVPHISNKDINNYQVFLPPLELQKHFGAFVTQIDKSKLHSKITE